MWVKSFKPWSEWRPEKANVCASVRKNMPVGDRGIAKDNVGAEGKARGKRFGNLAEIRGG